MAQIVEVNDEGDLYLPSRVLGGAQPHTQYAIEERDGSLVLTRLADGEPFWARAIPQERARAFREWAAGHGRGPALPDEVLRRESMYD